MFYSIDKVLSSSFQKESFLKNAFSHNIRSFLQWFSETQMFDSFIEDSLWRIKYRDICQTHLRSKIFFPHRLRNFVYLKIKKSLFTYFFTWHSIYSFLWETSWWLQVGAISWQWKVIPHHRQNCEKFCKYSLTPISIRKKMISGSNSFILKF